jgi:putative transposase
MISREEKLSIRKQVQLLQISRSSLYYCSRPVSEEDLELMRQIDKLHLEYPFAGSRLLRDMLAQRGIHHTGRKHVRTLMRRMGIEALYRKPNTSKPAPGHKIYPYLLRNQAITRPNQVWAMDISYVRPASVLLSKGGALLEHVWNAEHNNLKCMPPLCCERG